MFGGIPGVMGIIPGGSPGGMFGGMFGGMLGMHIAIGTPGIGAAAWTPGGSGIEPGSGPGPARRPPGTPGGGRGTGGAG